MTMPRLAILGSGPIGLEAALTAAGRGWDFTVYEAAENVAGHVRAWGHVRCFTPWDWNVSERMRLALGDAAPAGDALPTGQELADQLLGPLAALAPISEHIHTDARAVAVGREGSLKHELIGAPERAGRPFRLLVSDRQGDERVEHADAVIDATGTYSSPNALGDGGIPAPGERALADRIVRHLPDIERDGRDWAGRTILLTGAGHSAQTAARALARLDGATRVVWAIRSADPTWFAAQGDDPLPERAGLVATSRELAAGASSNVDVRLGYVTEALRGAEGDGIAVTLRNGGAEEVVVDRVLALNGGVGDFILHRQLQVHECYATAAPMKLAAALMSAEGASGDCLATTPSDSDTLTNPEPGFFILGSKSYGRNSQFLMRTGFAQVRDVFGLLDAAR